jgi:exopolyphosphatase / guanosine-5'-triphosphate,3'-diphosphate pyrophosphatase
MSNKKIAVIDLGTNTFHILLASISKNDFEVLFKEKHSVKIGQNGINQGLITHEAQSRGIKALKVFKQIIVQENVQEVYATATSAIRNAHNGKEFAQLIEKETGIKVRVISGDEEAELIYLGVKTALEIGQSTSLIMDIGGGSVEFIICNNTEIFWKQSFEIGAQRLLDLFHYHDPILPEEIENLKGFLKERLNPLAEAIEEYKPTVLIGSSGTFETLSDIYRIEKNDKFIYHTELPLPLDAYFELEKEIILKDRLDRLRIPGMLEMRADMIVVACLMINYIVTEFNLPKLRVSTYALKEGVLHNIINILGLNLSKKR